MKIRNKISVLMPLENHFAVLQTCFKICRNITAKKNTKAVKLLRFTKNYLPKRLKKCKVNCFTLFTVFSRCAVTSETISACNFRLFSCPKTPYI